MVPAPCPFRAVAAVAAVAAAAAAVEAVGGDPEEPADLDPAEAAAVAEAAVVAEAADWDRVEAEVEAGVEAKWAKRVPGPWEPARSAAGNWLCNSRCPGAACPPSHWLPAESRP